MILAKKKKTNENIMKQIYLYSLETRDFYTDEELKLNDYYFKALRLKKKIKPKLEELQKIMNYYEDLDFEEDDVETLNNYIKYSNKFFNYDMRYKNIVNLISKLKKELSTLIKSYPSDKPRTLRSDSFHIKNKIGLFESSLTRLCEMKTDETTMNMFVIRVFHFDILKSIMDNGFIYDGEKYIYLTSSARQIRTKKIVVIKESLYRSKENAVTCGMPLELINEKGGFNANKYQAYLALANSASTKWEGFNIDEVIVVNDFATTLNVEVDFVNDESFEITRKRMPIEIEHMDGCGIMLPEISESSFMFRMPWMKGLCVPIDFMKFIKENIDKGATYKIKDIYGKEYDLSDGKIKIILTKSQFKLHSMYDNWDTYVNNFKEYDCEAAKLNPEDIGDKATINYQMLQTLDSMKTNELEKIAEQTVEDLNNLSSDKDTILKVLGVDENKKDSLSPFQKSLLLYPELLNDSHTKEMIKSKKRKLVKDAKAGKLRVNGYYTFIIPDLYAFCEWLFMNNQNPKGLLENKQVYCNLFEEGDLDLLRAPHLYREHAIRNNIHKKELEKWFITKGVYTSVHDPISKILMFDVDGDKSLVVKDDTLINVAKRDMEDVVPLFYNMKKAGSQQLTTQYMYESLINAYKANIGIISNDITKIWNSDVPNIDAVRQLCMYNNFVIDFAKTLYMPTVPDDIKKQFKEISNTKLPHFFKYAKDKEEHQVQEIPDNIEDCKVVDKLEYIIPNKPLRFKKLFGEVDYKMLMWNAYTKHDESIVERFIELDKEERFNVDTQVNTTQYEHDKYVYREMQKLGLPVVKIVDILVREFFGKNSNYKKALWNVYGYQIYKNLERNMSKCRRCNDCDDLFKGKVNEFLCEKCKLERNRVAWRESKRKKRMSPKSSSQ